MYGHGIAKDLELWWATHGGKHDSPEWHAFLDDFSTILVSKLDEQRTEHDNAGRFGMSKAGGCTRAAVLKLRDEQAKPFSGSTRVTFWTGHMVEVLGIASLRAIGVPVSYSGENGKQYECRIDPYMHSYTDGIVEPDPRFDNVRMALSVKSAGYKMSGYDYRKKDWRRFGFAQYPFDGMKKTNPGYWAQAQAECRALGTTASLVLVVAKDTIKKMEGDPYLGEKGNGSLAFYAEVVPYDEAFACGTMHAEWGHAWRFYEAGRIPTGRVVTASGGYVSIDPADTAGNKAKTGTYDPCSYCDLFDACGGASLDMALRASIEAQEGVANA